VDWMVSNSCGMPQLSVYLWSGRDVQASPASALAYKPSLFHATVL
jgi:hypothetical protein